MRRMRISTVSIVLGLGYLLLLSGKTAHAQFSGPVVPPNLPIPTQSGLGQLPSNVRDPQVQRLLLLRALQQRAGSGGGVKTGVPQFIPFGNNFMPNAMLQQQTAPTGTVNTDAPKADGKSVAEKKAEYQAAREERKRKTRERAEKRKAEAAARARDKAAAVVPANPA